MKTVKLLLGNSDRRTNNIIEALVRDVCFERAMVECTRTSRIDEFLFLGTRDEFDLIIVAPDHFQPEPSRRSTVVPIDEGIRAVRKIKRQCLAPIIAVSVPAEYESPLLEAGVTHVLGLIFKAEMLESEVRRVLPLPEAVEQATPVRWSLAAALLRGLQRLNMPRTQ